MTRQQGIHRLIGYDRISGVAVVEHAIPATHLAFAKQVAEVGPDDPFVTRCYPLTPADACKVARAIGAVLKADGLNLFLEGMAEAVPFTSGEQADPGNQANRPTTTVWTILGRHFGAGRRRSSPR
jgi:hypothetical protein